MPFEGVQLDELLNGFLDGELSELESAQVKRLLAENSAARAQFDELKALRADLKSLSRVRQATAAGLGPDFASRVLAAAQMRAASDRQSSDPQVAATRVAVAQVAVAQVAVAEGELGDRLGVSPRSRATRRIALVGLAIAACLALMINSPGWLSFDEPSGSALNGNASSGSALNGSASNIAQTGEAGLAENPQDSIEMAANNVSEADALAVVDSQTFDSHGFESSESLADASAGTGEAVRLTNQWTEGWRQQLTIIMVVDMTLTAEAVNNDYVANVFAAHAIPLMAPIVADEELTTLVENSRMSEVAEQPAEQDALLYFVHADSKAVDQLLQTFLDDFGNIPTLRTDIAFDAPANQLVRKIVESSAGKLALDETFATPVSDEEGPRPSPFSGIGPQGKLVASSSRGQPTQVGGASLEGIGGEGKSSVLLLVRTPK